MWTENFLFVKSVNPGEIMGRLDRERGKFKVHS